MFLPYAEDAPKKTFSPATHGLILLQAIATFLVITDASHGTFVGRLLGERSLLDRWAFDPHSPSPLTFVAALFLHAGLAHFVGNALVLHMVGRPLEQRLGPARFLGLYFLSGALADLVFALATPHPCVGASGAIAGVMGAYVVLFPDATVKVAYTIVPILALATNLVAGDFAATSILVIAGFALFQAWTLNRQDLSWGRTFLGIVGIGVLESAAIWLVAFWAILQGTLAWVQLRNGIEGGATAYWAHLGGFLGGLAYGFAARRAPATFAPFAADDASEATPAVATTEAAARTQTRSTLRLGLKRELAAVLETGSGPSAVHLYAQAHDLEARPVLAPAVQEKLAAALRAGGRADLARLALEDLVAAHGASPEGQRAFRELAALTRPATRRVARRLPRELVESSAA